MRAEAFGQAGSSRTLLAGMPYCLVRDRPFLSCLLESRGEQVNLRLHFAGSPVRPQRVEQLRCERQFPITRVLSFMNVDDHSLAVDVGDLQLRGFGSPKTGGVQKQQDGSVANVGCGPRSTSRPLPRSALPEVSSALWSGECRIARARTA